MNSELMNLIFLGVALIFVVLGVVKGTRGAARSTVSLLCTVTAAVGAFLLSGPLVSTLGDYLALWVTNIISNFPAAADLLSVSPSLAPYLESVAFAFVVPVVFLLVFIVLKIVLGIVGLILKAFIPKSKGIAVASRGLGLVISVLSSLIAVVCVLAPFAGYANLASEYYSKLENEGVITATEQGKALEDVIKNSKDGQAVKLVYSLTGKFFDSSLTYSDENGKKTELKTELDVIVVIAGRALDFSETDFSDIASIDVQPVHAIVKALNGSGEIKTVVAEVLKKAATEWKNGNEFLGINLKEQLPDGYKNSLDVALNRLAETDGEKIVYTDADGNVVGDLPDFASAIETMIKLYSYSNLLSNSASAEQLADELANAVKALTPGAVELIGDAVKTIVSNDMGLSEENGEALADIVTDCLKNVAQASDEEKEKEAEALSEIITSVDNGTALEDADKLVSTVASSTVVKTAVSSAVEKGLSVQTDEATKAKISAAAKDYTDGEEVTEEEKEAVKQLLLLFGVSGD